jgi:hypothetical protein
MSHPPTAARLVLPVRSGLVLAAGLLLTGAVLTGCAASKSASGQAVAQASATGSQQGRSGFGGGPAAVGTLAEIDGQVLQVQNQATGQVSVSYSASTTFSRTETVTAAQLTVGSCVTAVGQRTQSSGSPSVAPSRPTSFPAATVQISAATNGGCAVAGPGGRGGTRPSGFPSGRPSGFPSGRPSGFPSGRPSGFPSGEDGGFGEFATGKVSAVSGSTVIVQTPARGQQAASTVTVTLTATTTYTETVPATAAALQVGECVSATGKAGTAGAVAATRIALTPAGPNGCTTGGFGRRPAPGASPTGS